LDEVGKDLIQRRRLYEEIEARLANDIVAGRLKEGDQLPSERALMERFGVGRPAVREALLSLRKKGLVAVISGERARVTRPTAKALVAEISAGVQRLIEYPDGMRHLQEVRTFFEIGLARIAAMIATEGDILELKERLAENKAAIGRSPEFEHTDVAFHYVLAKIPRNPIFTTLAEAVVGWLTEQRRKALLQPQAYETAYRFHRRIFLAVKDRDPDRAEAAMREHLGVVAQQYWNSIGKREEPS
jgi:GntR family transcriptional repressor for pyruvate dehydrogenase complex